MINGINNGSNSTVNGRASSRESAGVINVTKSGNSGSEKINEATRVDRVEEIKRQIERGEYQIDIDRTAQKVAETLLF